MKYKLRTDHRLIQSANSLALAVLLLVASGCGRGLAAPMISHGVFESYFQSFEAASIRQGRATYGDASIEISFGACPPSALGDAAGTAWYGNFQTPRITIDQAYWNAASEATRTELIWHELGHALLRRMHTLATMSIGYDGEILAVPASLMNPYITPQEDWIFTAFQAKYETELFQNAGH